MTLSPEQRKEVEAIAIDASERAARKAADGVIDGALQKAAEEAAYKAAREAQLDREEMRQVVAESVHQTLVQLGVDHTDPLEMQKDFQHLRDWRKTTDAVKKKSFLAAIGLLVTGAIALAWMGVTSMLETGGRY